MSKRSEIIEGGKSSVFNRGLIYTNVPGWIDLRYVQGVQIDELLHTQLFVIPGGKSGWREL